MVFIFTERNFDFESSSSERLSFSQTRKTLAGDFYGDAIGVWVEGGPKYCKVRVIEDLPRRSSSRDSIYHVVLWSVYKVRF